MSGHNIKLVSNTGYLPTQDMPDEKTFAKYQALIQRKLGIHLPDQKRAMVGHRLLKRLRHYGLDTFDQYFELISASGQESELKTALELITTNETFFFREAKHFDYLKEVIRERNVMGAKAPFRVWSAACSSGEEPYSIAMLLRDACVSEWEVMASDVNTQVIEKARRGMYLTDRTENIPRDYLRRFCRKGTDEFEGMLRITPDIRTKVNFFEFNLMSEMDDFAMFDVIFLRNVMIYFDDQTKSDLITRIASKVRPGGHLFIGHSESVHGLDLGVKLKQIQPAILQRP